MTFIQAGDGGIIEHYGHRCGIDGPETAFRFQDVGFDNLKCRVTVNNRFFVFLFCSWLTIRQPELDNKATNGMFYSTLLTTDPKEISRIFNPKMGGKKLSI